MAKRMTVHDVAARAGVSKSAVSLVLRESPLVKPETRARIERAIVDLGYVRDRAAGALRSRRSQVLGLVVPNIANPFHADLALGVEAGVERAGYATMLANTEDDEQRERRVLRAMHERRVDGVILCPTERDDGETIAALRRWRLPTVLALRPGPAATLDFVGPDNVGGARMAVEHLIALGHRRIGIIAGPRAISAGVDRLEGYRRALQAHGLPIDPRAIVHAAIDIAAGRVAAATLLSRPGADRPTAIFAFNDLLAVGVLLAARDLRLHIPDDVALVGFDDIAVAEALAVPLTTVALSGRAIGLAAADALLARLRGEEDAPPRQLVIPATLVVRESCGAGRAGGGGAIDG